MESIKSGYNIYKKGNTQFFLWHFPPEYDTIGTVNF